MKTASVRELHDKTGKLVGEAAKGRVIIIVKHGAPVAELRPLGRPGSSRALPDREAVLAKFPQLPGDSGRFLEDDRS